MARRSQNPDTRLGGPEPRLLQVLLELSKFGPKMTAFERCEKLGEAKAAYLELYPETGHGVAGGKARWGAKPTAPSFSAYIANQSAVSVRSVEADVRIYDRLTAESRAWLRAAETGAVRADLITLSDLLPMAQARALALIDKGKAVTLAEAAQKAMDPKQIERSARPRPVPLAAIPTEDLAAELRRRGWRVEGGGHG